MTSGGHDAAGRDGWGIVDTAILQLGRASALILLERAGGVIPQRAGRDVRDCGSSPACGGSTPKGGWGRVTRAAREARPLRPLRVHLPRFAGEDRAIFTEEEQAFHLVPQGVPKFDKLPPTR